MRAFAAIQPIRLIVLLLLALLAGLITDRLRSERVVFAPPITTGAVE